jgi:hypothetical protein
MSQIERTGDRGAMGHRWWQHVAENAGNQELLKSLVQRAVMGDSSAKAELELLDIQMQKAAFMPRNRL